MKKAFVYWLMSWMLAVGLVVWEEKPRQVSKEEVAPSPTLVPTFVPKSVLREVAFTSQAPFGEWGDRRHQDGCEEAVSLMVKCSRSNAQCPTLNGKIDREFAKRELLEMARWQVEYYGSYVDTSAEDTAKRLLGEYYGVMNYEVREMVEWKDIVKALMNEQLVVVPTDGRKLLNPYFTQPGPVRHMLVILGYDLEREEFITNDPGTRSGEGYRYPAEGLWEAIGDYPTGDHEPIFERAKKMIVVDGKELMSR